jgi:hypothetical protein
MRPHRHRPPGSHRDLPERDVAQLLHHRFGVVGFADAHAAARDDGVGTRRGIRECRFEPRGFVLDHT